jgi:hypothetical protein
MKREQKNINTIIEEYLTPQLAIECQRLSIPDEFVIGIYGIHSEPFGRGTSCEHVEENGKAVGVRIRIDSEIRNPFHAKMHLWHELKHAKDYYENVPTSEWRANLFVAKRFFSEVVTTTTRWILSSLLPRVKEVK